MSSTLLLTAAWRKGITKPVAFLLDFATFHKMAAPMLRSWECLLRVQRIVPLCNAALRGHPHLPTTPCVLYMRHHSHSSASIRHGRTLREKFAWMERQAPVFGVSGDAVTMLGHPTEYYNTLKTLARRCKKRMVLASLYLGTGKHEAELVRAISEALHDSSELEVTILLDCTRGSRGEQNSRTMLTPLLQQFPGRMKVALYHTPDLRGFLKRLVPERFNEVIGVSHLKVFIFDDTFMTSGANLSNDYFVNRQDRYIRIDDCPHLVSFHESLVKAVSRFSFRLHGDNSLTVDRDFGIHPFKGNTDEFKARAREIVNSVITPGRWRFSGNRGEVGSYVGLVSSQLADPEAQDRELLEEAQSEHSSGYGLDSRAGSSVHARVGEDSGNSQEFVRTGLLDTEVGQDGFQSDITTAGPSSRISSHKFERVTNGGQRSFSSQQDLRRRQSGSGSMNSRIDRTGPHEQVQVAPTSNGRTVRPARGDFNESDTEDGETESEAKSSDGRSQVDTWICPLVQMGPLGITVDQQVTSELLEGMEEGGRLHLASGYFNLTRQYKQILLRLKARCEILTASPQVNGFYGASGISGYIPDSYTYIADMFYRSVCRRKLQDRIHLHEYYRDGWTFHAKGLWYYLPGCSLPSLTMIGSPNFGHRSVNRDLESQLVVMTTNPKLQEQLHQEQEVLYSRAVMVDEDTYRKQDRKVPLWAKIVTLLGHTFY